MIGDSPDGKAPTVEELRRTIERLQREVADSHRAELALRESEGRFRHMADTAPVLIWMSGPHKGCTFFNKGWLAFTGRTMEQEIGDGWASGVHPDDLEACVSSYRSAFDARRRFRLEYRLRRADGEYRWLLDTGVPRYEVDGTFLGYIGSCIDITDMRRAQEQAVATQKLESLGVLAAGIAHDFNNLVAAVLAESESLLAGNPDIDALREGLERIARVAVRTSEIVRELMVYAGQETEALEPIDIGQLLREMLELLHVSIAKRASLEFELPERVPPVNANAAQIRRVILNLLTNASDALDDASGVITVSLAVVHSDAEPAPGLQAGDALRLIVSDTGRGMTREVQRRMFDPFFTTKREGRGLGLAAVRGIVTAHHGAITVSSAPGEGTRIEVWLPCDVRGTSADEAAASPTTRAVPAAGATLLIVDDEAPLRQAIARTLRIQGFTVLEAATGREALDAVEAHVPDIGAVLLDVSMPDLSGAEVFATLTAKRPGIPVILTSAYDRDRALEIIGAPPSTRYLRKPFRIAELMQHLPFAEQTRTA